MSILQIDDQLWVFNNNFIESIARTPLLLFHHSAFHFPLTLLLRLMRRNTNISYMSFLNKLNKNPYSLAVKTIVASVEATVLKATLYGAIMHFYLFFSYFPNEKFICVSGRSV